MKEYVVKTVNDEGPITTYTLDGFMEGEDKDGNPVLYKANTIVVNLEAIDNEINHLTERLTDLNMQKTTIEQ